MKILVLYAHPSETSFHAALHRTAIKALQANGHTVDDCDLYGEGFDPVLTREERASYHDTAVNRRLVERHVARLLDADALVLCYPVWSYGPPAILKGYFDRLLIPGIAFDLVSGKIVRKLSCRRVAVVTSYGQPRWLAWLNGDPPRKLFTRMLRAYVGPGVPISFTGCYDMNRNDAARLKAFLERVRAAYSAW